jgi:DNA anti-recombination protein RmuC
MNNNENFTPNTENFSNKNLELAKEIRTLQDSVSYLNGMESAFKQIAQEYDIDLSQKLNQIESQKTLVKQRLAQIVLQLNQTLNQMRQETEQSITKRQEDFEQRIQKMKEIFDNNI